MIEICRNRFKDNDVTVEVVEYRVINSRGEEAIRIVLARDYVNKLLYNEQRNPIFYIDIILEYYDIQRLPSIEILLRDFSCYWKLSELKLPKDLR